MKTFNITWGMRGIIRHIKIEAETEEEAIIKFYNMASDMVIVCDCEECINEE